MHTYTRVAVGLLFLFPASVALADIGADPNGPTTPQAFSFYCSPYTVAFVNGGAYIPSTSSSCTYTVPQTSSLKVVALYKGTIGNSTLVQSDLTVNSPYSTLITSPNDVGSPQPGDKFFAVSYGASSSGEIFAADNYFQTGAGTAPGDAALISYQWGAPLVVTADNKTMVQGGAMPALTATLSGFINGQTLATSGVTGIANCTTSATNASPAGSYPVTCTKGTLTSPLYVFESFVAGTLQITPAPPPQQCTNNNGSDHTQPKKPSKNPPPKNKNHH